MDSASSTELDNNIANGMVAKCNAKVAGAVVEEEVGVTGVEKVVALALLDCVESVDAR